MRHEAIATLESRIDALRAELGGMAASELDRRRREAFEQAELQLLLALATLTRLGDEAAAGLQQP